MNIFRLIGDMSHLLAIIILLWKIWEKRSCAGVSGKSQFLLALVFTTRYLDLLTNFVSIYNSVMKILFLAATYATLYLVYVKFRSSHDSDNDTFRIDIILIPVTVLSLLVNHEFSFLEVSWAFSIYLESVAIIPQLFVTSKTNVAYSRLVSTGDTQPITCSYLIALGSYRAWYLINWIYRYNTESFFDMISVSAGIVQTFLFCAFAVFYIRCVKPENEKMLSFIKSSMPPASLDSSELSEEEGRLPEKIPQEIV